MKSFLGVDPGLHGALAFYTVNENTQNKLTIIDLKLDMMKPKTFRKFTTMQMTMELVAQTLNMLIDAYGHPEFAVVETPASRPGEGVVSSFTFGKNCGLIEGVLYGMNIKVIQTVPSVWKPKLGLNRVKARSIEKAEELFKDCDVDGGMIKFRKPLRIADGRAEAACLAWWGASMGAKLL